MRFHRSGRPSWGFIITAMLWHGAPLAYAEPSDNSSTPPAAAQPPFDIETHPAVLHGYLGGFYFTLKNADAPLAGIGLSGGALGYISEAWQVGGGLRQAFSREAGFTTLFTAIDAKAIYCLSGSVGGGSEVTLFKGKPVVQTSRPVVGGWRLGVGLTQYFLNTSFSTVGFSGVGASLGYEWPVPWLRSIETGLVVERVSNGKTAIYPVNLGVQIRIGS